MNNIKNYKKLFKGLTTGAIFLFCFFVAVELIVNYFSFYFLFPVKNAKSYGYIEKSTARTIIPLNKYSKRAYAQLALPYELLISKTQDKALKKVYNKSLKKFGYVDKENKIVINYNFVEAKDFEKEYAIVAIQENNAKKFGTIDKNGNWVIKPKYEYLCPFMKYYTKACLDKKHCGIIDKFGNEITVMSYKIDRLNCTDGTCQVKLCAIGSKNKDISCNYFLW